MRVAALLALAAAGLHPAIAAAAVLDVGPGRAYPTLRDAANAARDGDTVRIYPGSYPDGARFRANRLTIGAAPGASADEVVLDGGVVDGKGILLIQGEDVTVENLTLTNARNPDGNGAGIRAEGGGLTIRNVRFRDNETSLLITPGPGAQSANFLITASSFDGSGTTVRDHIGHALYATEGVGRLLVENSTFRRGRIGHYVKSRADRTELVGNTIDDSDGAGSYLIDIPQGGAATIENNRLIKGANARNCCVAIAYGAEMYKGGVYVNPPGEVTISKNEFVNRSNNRVRFVYNLSDPVNPVAIEGNRLIAEQGRIVPLDGVGVVDGAAQGPPLLRYKGRSVLVEADRMVDRGWPISPATIAQWALAGVLAIGAGWLLLTRAPKRVARLPRLAKRQPKPPMHPSARPGRVVIRGKRYKNR